MNISIYSKFGCPYCEKAKVLCESQGLPFVETKIGADITREEFVETWPDVKTVPLILVDGFVIGGYDDFVQFLKKDPNEVSVA